MNIYLFFFTIIVVLSVILLCLWLVFQLKTFAVDLQTLYRYRALKQTQKHERDFEDYKIQVELKLRLMNYEESKAICIGNQQNILQIPVHIYKPTRYNPMMEYENMDINLTVQTRNKQTYRKTIYKPPFSILEKEIPVKYIESLLAKEMANWLIENKFIQGKYQEDERAIVFSFNYF